MDMIGHYDVSPDCDLEVALSSPGKENKSIMDIGLR
jgi:hypothetical protein